MQKSEPTVVSGVRDEILKLQRAIRILSTSDSYSPCVKIRDVRKGTMAQSEEPELAKAYLKLACEELLKRDADRVFDSALAIAESEYRTFTNSEVPK